MMRAVIASALVTIAALVLIVVIAVALAAFSPGTVTGRSFAWVSGIVVGCLLIAAGLWGGTVALRRLPAERHRVISFAGPVTVVTLAALPALADGQWGSVLLYELAILVGLSAALAVDARVRAAGHRR